MTDSDPHIVAIASKITSIKRSVRYKANKERQRELNRLRKERIKAENKAQKALIEQKREIERAKTRITNKRKYPDLFKIIESKSFHEWFITATGREWWKDLEYEPQRSWPFPSVVSELEYALAAYQDRKALNIAMVADLAGLTGAAKRAVIQRLATPEWRDSGKILALYRARDDLNDKFPDKAPFHVDHIIPVQGEHVCGLHVETNLRVIPGKQNIGKGNRYHPDELTDEFCWSIFVT